MFAAIRKRATSTPRAAAINNNIDRFILAMDVIDRVPRLRRERTLTAQQRFRDLHIEWRNYACEDGIVEVAR